MKKTLLVIDDDSGIRDSIQMVFEDEGYEVEASPDGSPIHNFDGLRPDVAILDIMLEKEDGRDLVRQIKLKKLANPKGLILISALPDAEESAMKAGADYFLYKPFNLDLLIEYADKITAGV